MFDKTRLLTAAKSLVGFRQDNNPIYTELGKEAQATASKPMTFNLTAKTITWTGDTFATERFAEGDSITITGTTSNNGTKTISNVSGNIITTVQSLVNETSTGGLISATGELQVSASGLNVNDLPSVNFEIISANLSEDIDADDYLSNVYESEILNVVNQFVNKAKQNLNTKELLNRTSIVSGVASMRDKVTQNARFVGYWIRPRKSNNLRTEIVQLGFQATAEQETPLKIFLYETSQLEPIATFDFPITKKYSLAWQDVADFIINYQSLEGGTGQDFILGYYESDPNNLKDYQLQNQALFMQFDCNCPGSRKELYGKYMVVMPIEFPNAVLNWNEEEEEYFIPLVDNVGDYVTGQTYGLVAKVNVTCDITDILCENISIFARALQHAIACRILYDAYASTRLNSVADSKRDQVKQFAVKYDGILNGYTNQDGAKIRGLIDTLTMDFSGMDNYCLPCKIGIMKGSLIR